MASKIAKLLRLLRSVSAAALRRPHAPILQVRALHAHALSSCDYVWRGVFFPRVQLAAIQAVIDRHYRSVFGLPKWSARRVLQAPLACGGPQAPNLYLRAVLLLAGTYFAASWGHNPLAAAAARKLLLTGEVAGWRTEGAVLQSALAEYGLILLPLPHPSVGPVQLHFAGSLQDVWRLTPLYVAVDGGLCGSAVSGGVLVWHPEAGVLYTAWYGLRVSGASPIDAEWLAKLTAMLLFARPHPAAFFVSDASHAQHRSPPPRPQCCRCCTSAPCCYGSLARRMKSGSVRVTPRAVRPSWSAWIGGAMLWRRQVCSVPRPSLPRGCLCYTGTLPRSQRARSSSMTRASWLRGLQWRWRRRRAVCYHPWGSHRTRPSSARTQGAP